MGVRIQSKCWILAPPSSWSWSMYWPNRPPLAWNPLFCPLPTVFNPPAGSHPDSQRICVGSKYLWVSLLTEFIHWEARLTCCSLSNTNISSASADLKHFLLEKIIKLYHFFFLKADLSQRFRAGSNFSLFKNATHLTPITLKEKLEEHFDK